MTEALEKILAVTRQLWIAEGVWTRMATQTMRN